MGNATSKKPQEGIIQSHTESNANVDLTTANVDGSNFVFPDHDLLPPEEVVNPKYQGVKKHVPAVVRWKHGGKEVYISGSYNNWQSTIRLSPSHEDFVAIVELPEGVHEYKFLVDGVWKVDPKEPSRVNEQGVVNNILEVKPSDFEVFEALAFDATSKKNDYVKNYNSSIQNEVFSQEIPVGLLEDCSLHPPALPPHLLNRVLLNQDIEMSYEPSLLPEPQHVMLNHMYALSIKDGVMALSATHRYKKKFVTTLLYKPI